MYVRGSDREKVKGFVDGGILDLKKGQQQFVYPTLLIHQYHELVENWKKSETQSQSSMPKLARIKRKIVFLGLGVSWGQRKISLYMLDATTWLHWPTFFILL